MESMPFHRGVALQCTAIMIALTIMALRPPERGAMLLLPLRGGSLAESINLASDADARMLGRGPLPGSIIVMGDRKRLKLLLSRTSIMVLAAPAVGCGFDGQGAVG